MLCLMLSGAFAAQAQTALSRELEQLRRLREQLQKTQQELSDAQAQAQAAQASERTLAAKLSKAPPPVPARAASEASAQARKLAELQQQLQLESNQRTGAQEELVRVREALGAAQQRLDQGASLARRTGTELEAERAQLLQLRTQLDTSTQQLGVCRNHNLTLVEIGEELIGKNGNFGFGQSVALREPFLQFKRVQLENMADAYRARIDEQRERPPSATRP